MARFVILFALVCGAFAVRDMSPFGESVLAELEDKLQQGTPLDELNSILGDIDERLSKAQDADDAANEADKAFCLKRDEKLATDISELNATINNLVSTEAELLAQETEANNLITTYQKAIEEEVRKINANRLARNASVQERAEQAANATAGIADARFCLSAITEIRDLVNYKKLETGVTYDSNGTTKLAGGQDDTAANYQEIRKSSVTGFLQALSKKISHPQVLNLVELASLTAATMSEKGDIDRLNNLLQQLEDELNQYIDDVEADEAALKRAHTQRLYDLDKEHDDLQRARSILVQKRINASTLLENTQTQLGITRDELKSTRALLNGDPEGENGTLVERANLATDCSARRTAYETRTGERTTERQTIAYIKDYLNQKLGKHFEDGTHMTANVTSSLKE